MTALTKPGGYLITLAFPIMGPITVGPPYSVSIESYAESLGSGWEKVLDRTSSLTLHEGVERVVVWKRLDN